MLLFLRSFWAGLGATESRMFHGQGATPDNIVEIIVLSFFVLVTWIFYKIEVRCKNMVKDAENYIRDYSINEIDKKLFSEKHQHGQPEGQGFFRISVGTAYTSSSCSVLSGLALLLSTFYCNTLWMAAKI